MGRTLSTASTLPIAIASTERGAWYEPVSVARREYEEECMIQRSSGKGDVYLAIDRLSCHQNIPFTILLLYFTHIP